MVRLMTATGRNARGHDGERTERALLEQLVGRELEHEGGEGLEVERAHEQGERQLLHGVDEDEQGRDEQARPDQGKVNASQGRPGPRAEGA